jgi:hypothetical protein
MLDSNQATNPNNTSVTESAVYNHTGSSYHEILRLLWGKALYITSALETQKISLSATPLSALWFLRYFNDVISSSEVFSVERNKYGLHKHGEMERKSAVYINVLSWYSTRRAEENYQYLRTAGARAEFWTT